MRLRSSQFVFLLLLACCVQVGDDCASQILSAAVYGQTPASTVRREAPASFVSGRQPGDTRAASSNTLALDSAALASHRTAWTVRRPALDSAAVSSFTGFLRA
jgi:hypothetical protein